MLINAKVKNSLEPESEAISLTMTQQLQLEYPVNFDDLLIGDTFQVESKHFGHITTNKTLINDPNHRLVRNPLFH